jgi:hypothetical protein
MPDAGVKRGFGTGAGFIDLVRKAQALKWS